MKSVVLLTILLLLVAITFMYLYKMTKKPFYFGGEKEIKEEDVQKLAESATEELLNNMTENITAEDLISYLG